MWYYASEATTSELDLLSAGDAVPTGVVNVDGKWLLDGGVTTSEGVKMCQVSNLPETHHKKKWVREGLIHFCKTTVALHDLHNAVHNAGGIAVVSRTLSCCPALLSLAFPNNGTASVAQKMTSSAGQRIQSNRKEEKVRVALGISKDDFRLKAMVDAYCKYITPLLKQSTAEGEQNYSNHFFKISVPLVFNAEALLCI